MINIKIVAIGKIKENFHRLEIDEFLKRLSKYCKINIIELEPCIPNDESLNSISKSLEKEGDSILSKIKDDEFLFLLDLHGKEISSEEFAHKMDQVISLGKTICFAIGGSYGLSDKVRKRSSFSWKLSSLTFTHQMTRALVLEQVYRAFKINNNEVYHK